MAVAFCPAIMASMVSNSKGAPRRSLLRSFSCIVILSTCVPHASSLNFSYNFSTPGVLAGADLEYHAPNTSAAADRIDLTMPARWSTGRMTHRRPLRLWDSASDSDMAASFTSNFTFIVEPVPLNSTNQGDGMAFFIAPYNASVPQDANGGFLGLFNNPNNTANTYFPPTVAIEFDSFNNTWDPPGTVKHVGVDVNGVASAAYAPLPDRSLNGTMSAWVRYDAAAGRLTVALRAGGELYNVSAAVDLRAAGLPQDAALGFSGATGDYVERHQILSWSFESSLSSIPTVVVDNAESKTSRKTKIELIAGLTSAGAIILVAALFTAWLCYHLYVRRVQRKHPDKEMDNEFKRQTGPRRFKYSELSRATRGFSDDEKLGEGGFGSVYRGFLQELGIHVAIKRVSKRSRQGRREYVSEVTIISRLRHRNLVQLLGWCHEADELLLVYELMANGNLETHLYSTTNVLAWQIRYNIVLGIASALLYLHQESEQCVVHRDIKPSNVMLDSFFNAKLGDFGLARLIDHIRGSHTTMLAGTKGYIDPKCVVTSRVGAESDVYSFGTVLLEIACGRKPVVPQEDESRVLLVEWVWSLYGRGAVLEAADARLPHGELDDARDEVERVLVVGLWCVHPAYEFRPTIRQAINVLQFEASLPELPLEMPVATYGPPIVVAASSHGSSHTPSPSTTATASTGGQSSASRDYRTARYSISSVLSGR